MYVDLDDTDTASITLDTSILNTLTLTPVFGLYGGPGRVTTIENQLYHTLGIDAVTLGSEVSD